MKNCKELMPSSYNTARFDQPLQATEWLRDFRITNEQFLSKVTDYYVIANVSHQFRSHADAHKAITLSSLECSDI